MKNLLKHASFVCCILSLGCASERKIYTYPSSRGTLAYHSEKGIASWYGGDDGFAGKQTATGEIYDPRQLTAAHKVLPLDTYILVTNNANGRQVIVRINDRGPYVSDRILDLSERAAELLDMKKQGTIPISFTVCSPDGSPLKISELDITNPFTIQLLSAGEIKQLNELKNWVDSKIGPSYVVKFILRDGQQVFRLRYGQFATRDEAEIKLRSIEKYTNTKGIAAFITRMK